MNTDKLPNDLANKSLIAISDSEIEDLIETIHVADRNINLPAPFTQNTIDESFKTFNCRRCGECCVRGADGIFLYPEDIKRISGYLHLSRKKFKNKYTFTNQTRILLPLPCPFYDSILHSCKIYQIRPRNCKLFPFFGSDNPLIFEESSLGFHDILLSRVMTVNARCPAGREIACEYLKKMKRNSLASKFYFK